MMSDQMPSKMLALDRECIGTIVQPSHQSGKTMLMVFFGVNGIGLVKLLPEATKLTSEDFKG
jgi:hypothetical protein